MKKKASASIKKLEPETARKYIESRMPDFARMLPEHINSNRFLTIVMNEFRRNPKLLDCSVPSLIGALMQCAQTGLEPGPLQQCALIPYAGEIQFQIMYKGLIRLMWNSKEVKWINAEVVHENDNFNYQQGLNPSLHHEPTLEIPGEKIAVYAASKLINGGAMFKVLTSDEVKKVKKKSKAKFEEGKPWFDWEDEMWKKTALKRLGKLMPLDTETSRKIAQDETIKRIEIDQIGQKNIDVLDMPDLMDWNKNEEDKIVADELKKKTDSFESGVNVKEEILPEKDINADVIVEVKSKTMLESDQITPDPTISSASDTNPNAENNVTPGHLMWGRKEKPPEKILKETEAEFYNYFAQFETTTIPAAEIVRIFCREATSEKLTKTGSIQFTGIPGPIHVSSGDQYRKLWAAFNEERDTSTFLTSAGLIDK